MSALAPLTLSAPERAHLRFSFGRETSITQRYALALALWLIGGLFVYLGPITVGVPLILTGHLPLWARVQTTAPAPAAAPPIWAPTDEPTLRRLAAHERLSGAWDVTPWEITNFIGLVTFGLIVLGGALLADRYLPRGSAHLLLALLGPLWFSGIRAAWTNSRLCVRARAIEDAIRAVRDHDPQRYEIIPFLSLVDGRRGKYPVDVRAMLRPRDDADPDLLGVQIQVTLNEVRGALYPYVYCVILVKESGAPPSPHPYPAPGLVYQRGRGEGVTYLVIRQHADDHGGWHTGPAAIDRIVREALAVARLPRRHAS